MNMTSKDSRCCDCCTAPYIIGDVWSVKEVYDAQDKEFFICESCSEKIKECGITDKQLGTFIADMSMIFDIWAMAESGKGAEYFLRLARRWVNWGLNCE